MYGDNEVGSDGMTKRERKLQTDSIAYDKMLDEMILKQVESIGFEDVDYTPPVEEVPRRRIGTRRTQGTQSSKYSSNISTVRARAAATALSGTRTRPTAMAQPRPRVVSSMFAKKPHAPTNPSPMRNTAAVAISNTTLGYTKGRGVSSKIHGKTTCSTEPSSPQGILSTDTYVRPEGTPPLDSDLEFRLPEIDRLGHEEELLPTYEEDEETQNFQLTL